MDSPSTNWIKLALSTVARTTTPQKESRCTRLSRTLLTTRTTGSETSWLPLTKCQRMETLILWTGQQNGLEQHVSQLGRMRKKPFGHVSATGGDASPTRTKRTKDQKSGVVEIEIEMCLKILCF